MKKVLLAVLVVIALVSIRPLLVSADDGFVHHVDAIQAAAFSNKTVVADIGYHFTSFRVAERLQVIGAGMMLDINEKNVGDEFDSKATAIRANFILTVPIVDIALMKPTQGKDWGSFSVRYGYDLNRREHLVLFGFSLSCN